MANVMLSRSLSHEMTTQKVSLALNTGSKSNMANTPPWSKQFNKGIPDSFTRSPKMH